MRKPKSPQFEVYARIVSCVSCKVAAKTLEEAMEIGRTLRSEDFYTIDADCELLDDNIAITGAYNATLNYNTDQQP